MHAPDPWQTTLQAESISQIASRFKALAPPAADQLRGDWRGTAIGPAWLRLGSTPSLALIGFSGWFGKRLCLAPEGSINLFGAAGERTRFPMACSLGDSVLDGQPAILLGYGAQEPWPWPRVRDELRSLDDHHLLGQTQFGLPVLRAFCFPFLLSRSQT